MSPPQGGSERRAKRYGTILADPPWDILQKGSRGAERHYPLLSTTEIASLPVQRLAADDAHLWLWLTNGSLFAGHAVLEAWGFTFRSMLTWTKPQIGLGHYLRNQTEHVLLGTRGKAPIRFRAQGSWLYAPRQEHSHKPEEQYAVIERCRPGWHAWGNQVHSDVAL